MQSRLFAFLVFSSSSLYIYIYITDLLELKSSQKSRRVLGVCGCGHPLYAVCVKE